MFFFKSKKIVVDCFTNNDILHRIFPPKLASNYFPEWWKKLPKTYKAKEDLGIFVDRTTMKSCDGFIDLYKKGFMVPMWCDLYIEQSTTGYKYVYSNNKDLSDNVNMQKITDHDRRQSGGHFDNFSHGKIIMPWAFKETTGVNFLLLEPIWSNSDKWKYSTIPHGVVNFRYIRRPHVNTFFTKEDNNITFKCGEPLVHFVPLSEKRIELRQHLVDDREYLKLVSTSEYIFTFRNKQRNLMKFLKANNCPFA